MTHIEKAPPSTRIAAAASTAQVPTSWQGRLSWVAAAAAYGEAIAHIPVTQMHLTEAPYIGVGFVLLSIAGFLLGHLLIDADTLLGWLACAQVAFLALVGYVLSRTVGLPQIRDDVGNWGEPLGVVAFVCESVMLACSVARLFGFVRTTTPLAGDASALRNRRVRRTAAERTDLTQGPHAADPQPVEGTQT